MNPLRFRKAGAKQRAWVLSLAFSYLKRRYPQLVSSELFFDDFIAFVNERNGKPIGGLLIRFGADGDAEIHAVCAPALFREELARRTFLEFLEYQAEGYNVKRWVTTVRADNHDVIDALEFCGFRQDGSQGSSQFLSYSREA